MAKHIIPCELTVEDKTFTNADKQLVEYVSITAFIGGEEVHLSVKKEDRSLLRILRRDYDDVSR